MKRLAVTALALALTLTFLAVPSEAHTKNVVTNGWSFHGYVQRVEVTKETSTGIVERVDFTLILRDEVNSPITTSFRCAIPGDCSTPSDWFTCTLAETSATDPANPANTIYGYSCAGGFNEYGGKCVIGRGRAEGEGPVRRSSALVGAVAIDVFENCPIPSSV